MEQKIKLLPCFFKLRWTFKKIDKVFPESHKDYEDMDMILEDFDNDGDLDLYIVSGGNEFELNDPILKDRLYVNDGLEFYLQ